MIFVVILSEGHLNYHKISLPGSDIHLLVFIDYGSN